MKIISEFPEKIEEIADQGITLADGTRLSARIWRPVSADKTPVPAILEYLPYRKRDGTIERDEITHPWFAGNGYACVRVDIRGNGESEGLMNDEYTPQELSDACEIINWLSQQDWCDGNVGMKGISWGGFNALQVAALNPPALKAVIANCSTVDRYADDIHYKGGALLGENFGWASQMLSYSSRPPDPMLVGDENWIEVWKHRLENLPYLWSEWHTHQTRDDYWKHGSICEDYSAIKIPVLTINGWHDGYRNTVSHLVENVEAPTKGILGPWIHKYPHYAGPKPAIGYLQEAKRWWDNWLKGMDTGVEADPDYRVWLMDSIKPKRWHDERPGQWITEDTWPSPKINFDTLHMTNAGLRQQSGDLAAVIASPQDCGMAGGEYFPFAFSDEFPDEQSHDDERSYCCDGEILTEPLDIVGMPKFSALLTSDQPNAHICVRLCDLRPDGTSALITHGVFNLTHRTSHETPEPMPVGERVEINFALDQIAYRIAKEHRLRIAVSNAYWPYIWPSPETATLNLSQARLDIPLRTVSNGDEYEFEEAEGSQPWEHDVLREGHYARRCFKDEETGHSIVEINCDNGENRDKDHGLISGGWTKERWSIHPDDPNSAISEIDWEQTGGRPDQMWRTETSMKMWCDAETFFSTGTVKCWLNDELLFERDYRDGIARNLV